MGKRCSYGTCNSDIRYDYKDYMQGVFFIPFPKPPTKKLKESNQTFAAEKLAVCRKWIHACGRPKEDLNESKITRNNYICSKHFVGGNGPTDENPDPLIATKVAPKSRKRRRVERNTEVTPDQSSDDNALDNVHIKHTFTQTDVEIKQSKATQATPPSLLSAHISHVIRKNEYQGNRPQRAAAFSFESCKEDNSKFKFYTGLHVLHFMTIWNFLGNVTSKLSYWRKTRVNENTSPSKRSGPPRKLSPINQLFMTLLKLRRGYSNRDIGYRFDVSPSYVSTIIITWIQLLFHEFQSLRSPMFPSRQKMKPNLAACFKPFRNIRVIVDCTEFFVNMPENFAKQANLYSNYKHHHTYKVLIGLSPTGAICFISEAFEGAKSDKEVFLESGIMDMLNAGDLVMADRGFTIEQELANIGVELNIPPFLHGRDKLTPQEEVKTKRIARCRIHVERIIERMKNFKILKGVIPLRLGPLFSQIIFVIGCLVNFEKPIC